MPDRSVKMKRRIFGFQRRVWWPKWTPASSRSRMVATAIGLLFGLWSSCNRRASGGPAECRHRRLRRNRRVGGTGRGKSSGETAAASGARPLERRDELGRERRGDVHLGARHGVDERKARRVQELPLEAELTRPSVERV